jgi:hypothetical protein
MIDYSAQFGYSLFNGTSSISSSLNCRFFERVAIGDDGQILYHLLGDWAVKGIRKVDDLVAVLQRYKFMDTIRGTTVYWHTWENIPEICSNSQTDPNKPVPTLFEGQMARHSNGKIDPLVTSS